MQRNGLWIAMCATAVLFSASGATAEDPLIDCGMTSGYQQGAAWPTYQGCSTRLGQSKASVGSTADPNWSRDLFGNVRSPVVDKNGIVYVGAGLFIHAINPDNGNVIWSTPMWANVASSLAIGADGTLYAVSVAGVLTALDPADGSYKWTYWVTLNASINTSPVIDSQGDIYFVDSANVVHAVHPDGSVKWLESIPGPILSSLALSRDDKSLYVGSSALGMRAVSTDNGGVEWVNLTYAGEFSAPTVGADGTIYAGSSDGRLYAINPYDGATKWYADNVLFFFDQWGAITVSPALTPDGAIVFGTESGKLVSLDKNGNVNWEEDLGWAITGSPVVDAEGVIIVGTASHEVFAIDSVDGTEIWSYPTANVVASSAAIGLEGEVLIGSNDNHLYSIGKGRGSGIVEPITVGDVDAPLVGVVPVATDDNGNEGDYDPQDQNNVGGSSNPNGHVATCYDTMTVADVETQGGVVLSRPGLNAAYLDAEDRWEINGIINDYSDPRCAANLCSDDETQLTASDETLLLRDDLSSPADLGNLYQPCAAVEGCGANSIRFDFSQTDYSLICSSDTDCSGLADHRCATVCPEDGSSGAPQEECESNQLEQRCVKMVEDPNCGGLPAPADDPDSPSFWCHELRECAIEEDIGDAEAPCYDLDGNPQDCESDAIKNQQEAAVLAAGPTTDGNAATYPPLALKSMKIQDKCEVVRPENADKEDSGGSNTQSGGNKPKWGIEVNAGLNSDFKLRPEASSLFNPRAHVDAGFNILGYVMGREIKVLGVNGSATVDTCSIGSEASAVLFNQDIAAFDTGAQAGGGDSRETECNRFRNEVLAIQGITQGRLADVVKVYNRVIRADSDAELGNIVNTSNGEIDPNARTVTKDLCRAISGGDKKVITDPMATRLANASNGQWTTAVSPTSGLNTLFWASNPGQEVLVNPLCDAPLTRETAAALLNVLIDEYRDVAANIPGKLAEIFAAGGAYEGYLAAMADPADGVPFDTSNGIFDEINVPSGLGQDFSIVGAKAVFPIGPVQLILEVQGTGNWGIVGGVRYGVKYDLTPGAPGSNKELASAEASANVGPSAGVYVDVYVGVGFDFGIAGASVGIGGELELLGIELPANAGVKLAVTESSSQPAGRQWPGELANLQDSLGGATLFEPKSFRMTAGGTFGAGAKFSALSGQLDLRLRIKVLFFKKTWKKRIAKFKGFEWEKAWVGEFASDIGEIDGLPVWDPQLDVLPAIPFPDIPRVSPGDFPALPQFSSVVPGISLPSTPSYDDLRAVILDDANGVPITPTNWSQPASADSAMMTLLDNLNNTSPSSAGIGQLPCAPVDVI